MEHAYRTEKGLREINQDSVWLLSSAENPNGHDVDRCGALFAVADGVGGHRAGEVASRMACDGLAYYCDFDMAHDSSIEARLAALRSVFVRINREVFRKSVSANEFFMMGTTLSALVIVEQTALIAHVGDSRIYRLRGPAWELLTRDHTEVQELVDRGELSPEQARSYPRKQWLTAAIGAEPDLEKLYSRAEPVEPGDRFLLCTDGSSNYLTDTQMSSIVRENANPDGACDQLLQQALDAGSDDNLTAMIVHA